MSEIKELLAVEAVRQQPTHRPAFAKLMRSRRKRDWRNRFLAGAVVVLALGALGGSVLFNHQPTVPSVPGDGVVVTGTLLQVGGRLGTAPRGLAGTVHFQAADDTVIDTAAASDGRFRITVSPGQYIVTGRPRGAGTSSPPSLVTESSPGVVASGPPDAGYSPYSPCRADAPVTVPSAGLTGVQVICHIR